MGGFLPVTSETPHEIHLSKVGRTLTSRGATDDDYDYDDAFDPDEGQLIDLHITNLTEYRGYDTWRNGVKVTDHGAFGVINLLAPRSVSMGHSWDLEHTFVRLLFAFTSSTTQQPLTLERTFLTFYDFDTGHRYLGRVAIADRI